MRNWRLKIRASTLICFLVTTFNTVESKIQFDAISDFICTCSHSSEKEIHSINLEFKIHSDLRASLPDCHRQKKETHVCACKKHNGTNKKGNLRYSMKSILNEKIAMFIEIKKSYVSIYEFSFQKIICIYKLIKPPRISPV
jgi:hypothetical protein